MLSPALRTVLFKKPNLIQLDGVASLESGATGSATQTLTLTTTRPDELILVMTWNIATNVTSVSDAAGLTWIQLAPTTNLCQGFWAKAPNPLTSDVIRSP